MVSAAIVYFVYCGVNAAIRVVLFQGVVREHIVRFDLVCYDKCDRFQCCLSEGLLGLIRRRF